MQTNVQHPNMQTNVKHPTDQQFRTTNNLELTQMGQVDTHQEETESAMSPVTGVRDVASYAPMSAFADDLPIPVGPRRTAE